MGKTKKILALIAGLVCLSQSIDAAKTVYIPTTFNTSGAEDYCNKNGSNGTISSLDDLKDNSERWSKTRSLETDNIICFWESGFGTDPTKMVDPSNTSKTFNLKVLLDTCESILKHHVQDLQATWADGTNYTQYKMLFMLDYTTDWVAYGSGYDDKIGAMWVCPGAIGVNSAAEYPYATLAHEMFHSVSYQCGADAPSSEYRSCKDENNGPFWERSANHASGDLYVNWNMDLSRYMYATQSHYLHTRKHYTTSFLLLNMEEEFGKLVLGQIWKYNKTEHVLQTATRLFFNDDIAKLNDYVANTAMKNITFDYADGTNGGYYKSYIKSLDASDDNSTNVDPWNMIMKSHRCIPYAIDYDKRHFAVRDCQAPQDFGYNAIRIYPDSLNSDGTGSFTMRFRGHTGGDAYKKSGWRWGFVAVESDGSERYGTVYSDSDKTVTFNKTAADEQIWLIVTGAPTEFNSAHWYIWEAGYPKYYRYPYEIRFSNATPMGYNADWEGSKSNGSAHSNGGGWVASTASVDASAYVGPHAKVLGNATVSGNARIEDFAVVKGGATISGNAVIKENALVFANAKVYGDAVVSGEARVFNNCDVSGNAFITDNAFAVNTTITDNAILCGNAWQRDFDSQKISGTHISGGDAESVGFISTTDSDGGAETSGTFLQWPESTHNNRARHDGKGNMSASDITTLKANWNNVLTKLQTLNKTISTSTDASNPNYDINTPGYFTAYYTTDSEMSLDNAQAEGAFEVSNQGSYVSVTGTVPSGTTYSIKNAAGVEISNGTISSATSIGIPSGNQSGNYTITIVADGTTYCEEVTK